MSEPREEHLLLGTDYSVLESILPRLSRRVCFTASETPRAVKTSPTGEWINKARSVTAAKLDAPPHTDSYFRLCRDEMNFELELEECD